MIKVVTSAEVTALRKAAKWLFHFEYCPYLELKQLRQHDDALSVERFRHLFAKYYGFNQLRLAADESKNFESSFFKLLGTGTTDTGRVLLGLHTLTGNMQFSLATKLVAMNAEASPIYDRHVGRFFGFGLPATNMVHDQRIDQFVRMLRCIKASYEAWNETPELSGILSDLIERHSKLADCHSNRLWDFLIWNVGNKKIPHKELNERN